MSKSEDKRQAAQREESAPVEAVAAPAAEAFTMTEAHAMAKPSGEMSDAQLVDALGIFFPRPPADPNRPRPIVDAIKKLVTDFIGQLGPAALPMLLDLILKLIGQAQGAPAATAQEQRSYWLAKELGRRHMPRTADAKAEARANPVLDASDSAIWDSLVALLVQFANQLGPQLIPILIELLKKLLGVKSAA